jgi:hypothetical protein
VGPPPWARRLPSTTAGLIPKRSAHRPARSAATGLGALPLFGVVIPVKFSYYRRWLKLGWPFAGCCRCLRLHRKKNGRLRGVRHPDLPPCICGAFADYRAVWKTIDQPHRPLGVRPIQVNPALVPGPAGQIAPQPGVLHIVSAPLQDPPPEHRWSPGVHRRQRQLDRRRAHEMRACGGSGQYRSRPWPAGVGRAYGHEVRLRREGPSQGR